MLRSFFFFFLSLYKHLEEFNDFSMYIDVFIVFWILLREILKDDDELLINSLLDSCLNDRRFEQKYIDSRTVVLPALL